MTLFLLQVQRLLSLASAMSSAQSEVTGSPKLDLGGVMAALAVTQGTSKHSFLHGGWQQEERQQKSESSETKRMAQRSSEGLAQYLAGRKAPVKEIVQQGRGNSSFLHGGTSAGGAVSSRKAIFETSSSQSSANSSDAGSPGSEKRTVDFTPAMSLTSLTAQGKPSYQPAYQTQKPSYQTQPPTQPLQHSVPITMTCQPAYQPMKPSYQTNPPVEPPAQSPQPLQHSVPITLESSNAEDRQESLTCRTLSARAAMFETAADNHTALKVPVATVFDKKPAKVERKDDVDTTTTGETSLSLGCLLDPQDEQVAQLLQVVSSLVGERQRGGGDGRLDMGGLLEALARVEGIQVQEKEAIVQGKAARGQEKDARLQEKRVDMQKAGEQIRESIKTSAASKLGIARAEQARQASLSGVSRMQEEEQESDQEARQSWQEALRGARRPGGVRSEGGLVLAQPALATMTPPPPPLPPRDPPSWAPTSCPLPPPPSPSWGTSTSPPAWSPGRGRMEHCCQG